jgi:isoquinoline 1-oxidoreductase beta subunit
MNEEIQLSRRQFLRTTAAATSGLVVAFHLPMGSRKVLAEAPGQALPEYPPNAFVRIAPDNSITVTINKLEMGQGVNTSMAQLIAEELECDWTKIQAVSAPVAAVYNHTVFPMQMTGGSTALATSYDQYRRIGASMREMLVQAAAQKWKVSPNECHAENSFVVHPKKGKLSYGELAEAANKLPMPKQVKLKAHGDFKVIGKSVARVDAPDKVNGKAVFGIDVRLPDMQYAVIARSPVLGGKLVSVDDKKAKAVNGVQDVVRFGDSVAVLATNTWAAKKGRDALEIKWDFQGKDSFSNESLMADFKKQIATEGAPVQKRGDAKGKLKKAAHRIVAEYEFPYLAHACMEPMNCTINFDGKRAEIWAGHQMPTGDRDTAAAVLGIPKENVQVHTVYAGGSFGRRANKNSDYVKEAAELAKVIKRPVKIAWTREDDMTGGYYRPMNYHRAELGFDAKNRLIAWDHRIVGQSVVGGSPFEGFLVKNNVDATVVEGVGDSPYDIPNFSVDLHMPKPNVTTLWWRSVGHSHTAYVMETAIDEIAFKSKKDPLALRKQLLAKAPRHLAVLELLEKHSGWGKKMPKGRALGLAVHESFGSVVGHVAEVSYDKGRLKVHKIVSAVHCGQVVNPEGAKAQVEGAIAYGLSAALHGEIVIKEGKVMTKNFDEYDVLRFPDMPVVEVYFVESHANPTGLGEPGLPPTAPAVANALFKLTGKRIRKLPFTKELKPA